MHTLFRYAFLILCLFLGSCNQDSVTVKDIKNLDLLGSYTGINPENGDRTTITFLEGNKVICENIPLRVASGNLPRNEKYKSKGFQTEYSITDLTPSGKLSLNVNGYFIEIAHKKGVLKFIYKYDVVKNLKILYVSKS